MTDRFETTLRTDVRSRSKLPTSALPGPQPTLKRKLRYAMQRARWAR